MEWSTAAGIIAASLPVVGTIALATTSKHKQWQAFSEEMREWSEDRLNELKGQRDHLAEENASLKARLEEAGRRYRAAIRYLRYVLARFRSLDPNEPLDDPPSDLCDDL